MKNKAGDLPAQKHFSSPHHLKLTVIDMEAGEKGSAIFRRVSLKKYNTNRYIAKDPPKPVSRILIIGYDQ